MINQVSEYNSKQLSVCIKQIYENVIFEERIFNKDIPVVDAILSAVEESGKAQTAYFLENQGVAYAYDNHEDLVRRFFNKISSIIDDIILTISNVQFSLTNSADIMSLVVPYTLIKLDIPSVDIAFFAGLSITVSKIIVEFISQSKERKEKVDANDIKRLCQINIDYLQKIDESDLTKELLEYRDSLLLFSASLEANLKDSSYKF